MWSGSGAPFDSVHRWILAGLLGISFVVFSLVALEKAVGRLTKLAKKARKEMKRMTVSQLLVRIVTSGGLLAWTRSHDLI